MTTFTLGTWADGGAAKVDISKLLASRLLLQAGSGFGKSWALRRLLEQTAGHVQQFVIDPEGEFATLREKHDYVIAAVNGGDALAHPRTAGLLLRRLMETGVSAILDISELKKPERRRFVRLFLEELMGLPREMWAPLLVVVDEAHEFAPEKDEAESLSAVVDLATRGRKRGFALVAATQRIGKFAKDVAAELHNKLIGYTSLDIDVKRAAFELGMSANAANEALRNLKPGEFFASGPATSQAVRQLKSGTVETTHPQPGTKKFRAPPKPTEAIKAVLPKLADLPKEAEEEARTIEDLRRELANARRELTRSQQALQKSAGAPQTSKTGPDPQARQLAATVKRQTAIIEDLMKFIVEINARDFAAKAGEAVDAEALQRAIEAAVARSRKLIEAGMESRNRELRQIQTEAGRLVTRARKLLEDQAVKISLEVRHQESFAVTPTAGNGAAPARRALPRANGSGESMPKAERLVLTALAQYPDGRSKTQVAILTGYASSGGGFNNALSSLRSKGYLEGSADRLTITDAGVTALGAFDPLPHGDALLQHWLGQLGKAERATLETLAAVYPSALTKEDAASRAGYEPSGGGFNNALSRLRTLELITGRGELKASEDLFS